MDRDQQVSHIDEVDMKANTGTSALQSGSSSSVQGTILVPCIFILSLISLLTVGILNAGGMGNSAMGALTERSRARMAALSGVEVAYRRLAEGLDYGGEQCNPFDDDSCSVDITVTDLGDYEYEVMSHGVLEESECLVRTRALARQWVFDYPFCVGDDMLIEGNHAYLMGDCYVKDILWSKAGGTIAGNLYMPGERDVVYDAYGKPIRIDGYNIPTIEGELHCNQISLDFPTLDLTDLRALAAAAGQVYSGSVYLRDEDFEGVVYMENCNGPPKLKNVTIHGVLVLDDISVVQVKNGYLKIRADDAICPSVAILAPDT